jgi:hypothetical protein
MCSGFNWFWSSGEFHKRERNYVNTSVCLHFQYLKNALIISVNVGGFFEVRGLQKQLWLQGKRFSIANYNHSRSQGKVQAAILMCTKSLHCEVIDMRASGLLVACPSKGAYIQGSSERTTNLECADSYKSKRLICTRFIPYFTCYCEQGSQLPYCQ